MGLFDDVRRWLGREKIVSPGPTPVAADEPAIGQPSFPFPLVTVRGDEALATWVRLRAAGDGYPVIIGPDEEVDYLRDGIESIEERTPEQILAAAARLTFPASLKAKREEDDRRSREYLREREIEIEDDDELEPELGEWPSQVDTVDLTVATHYTGKVYDRVHIALLPCRTGWKAIAHLRWGNWNENPEAEYHIAALKSWHERYGAELIGCSHDVINLRVTRRPATRDEAIMLAREQYLYCNDIVDQGVGTISGLAAVLMAGDWWYFWWD